MSRFTDRLERALHDDASAASRTLLGVALPIVFDVLIIVADIIESPKTAYVGLLASAPMLSAVFATRLQVIGVSAATWLAAFAFGHFASDGNVAAQTVRLFFIALISLLAIGSADLRTRRERRFAEVLIRTAEAESMRRLAGTDMLTGLLNRRGFFAARDSSRPHEAALAVIDIDGLKRINDEHGHPAGDAFIVAVAQRLKTQFRDVDHVARWGGDEFLLEIAAEPAEALVSLERAIAAASADPVLIDGERIPVSLSAGIAAWPPGVSFDDAYRVADTRMYGFKHGGRRLVLGDD